LTGGFWLPRGMEVALSLQMPATSRDFEGIENK
jgi:hypothetical protein